ncbi:DUF2293 domain-containing protein [Aquimarina intermedia]|uniref:DUF2293 domain-containing protein n=1 Tax=Aquimarina intermedia TaxID=350814 RepID=A0A5S5CA72_9FLAO|nr:DUF2293 domain-containing protein [Aquimarina intermedia]TYP75230.1 hypothetical protein BD809_103294 [Aquimarina intermedia]
MATESQNIFLTKKEKLKCSVCGKRIPKGKSFVAESENHKGSCFTCSPFVGYVFLPSGDAALTRRSKKHSDRCAVVLEWNVRRKRFQRTGQLVQEMAIKIAEKECAQDAAIRAEKNKKAAIVREQQDRIYVAAFAKAIRARYPVCPSQREVAIAQHACEKYSGRVGRTADAKQFDAKMIDLAVEAHIRHTETNYEAQFGRGKGKKQIRSEVKTDIQQVLRQWRGSL